MSCLPPEQMPPMERDGRRVVLYPSCAIGVSEEERGIGIVLNHPYGLSHTSPALLLNEKDTTRLILELQAALRKLSQLPVSFSPLD